MIEGRRNCAGQKRDFARRQLEKFGKGVQAAAGRPSDVQFAEPRLAARNTRNSIGEFCEHRKEMCSRRVCEDRPE